MLCDNNPRCVRWHLNQYFLYGFGAACRGTNSNYLISRFEMLSGCHMFDNCIGGLLCRYIRQTACILPDTGACCHFNFFLELFGILMQAMNHINFRFGYKIDGTNFHCVRDETITTGIGRSRIRLVKNVTPSIFGISTSSVSTSGFSFLIFSRATSGSGADPTTSIERSLDNISVSICLIRAESSIINTLILLLSIFKYLQAI